MSTRYRCARPSYNRARSYEPGVQMCSKPINRCWMTYGVVSKSTLNANLGSCHVWRTYSVVSIVWNTHAVFYSSMKFLWFTEYDVMLVDSTTLMTSMMVLTWCRWYVRHSPEQVLRIWCLWRVVQSQRYWSHLKQHRLNVRDSSLTTITRQSRSALTQYW